MKIEELLKRKLELELELRDIDQAIAEKPKIPCWRAYLKGVLQIEARLKDGIWSVEESIQGAKARKKFSEKEFDSYKLKIKTLYLQRESHERETIKTG